MLYCFLLHNLFIFSKKYLNMAKIRITENILKQIVAESVKKILKDTLNENQYNQFINEITIIMISYLFNHLFNLW